MRVRPVSKISLGEFTPDGDEFIDLAGVGVDHVLEFGRCRTGHGIIRDGNVIVVQVSIIVP